MKHKYLNKFQREHRERLKVHLSRQPKASLQDALAQYDKIERGSSRHRHSAKESKPMSAATPDAAICARKKTKCKSHGVVLAKLVDPSVFKNPLNLSRVPKHLPVPGRVPRSFRRLKLSPELISALRRTGALNSSLHDFCRRFPYSRLRKSPHFSREVVNELMEELTPLSAYSETVGIWVASFPFPKVNLPDADRPRKNRRK
jgi:hypothetical protein